MAVKADITIDIDKQVGELQNLSQIYNARVGDNKTPLTVAWRKNDLPLNLKGLHAYIVGKTGDGSFNEETGKIDFPVGTPVSQFEDDGTGTLDGGQSGLTTLLIPKQMWQKSGVFAGYIGLKSADGSVFTSKDIWFKVLGNVLDAGVEINYFISDFDKALAEAKEKSSQLILDARNAYLNETKDAHDSLDALKSQIQANRDEQQNLNNHLVGTEQQIQIHDIVTIPQHKADIDNISDAINKRLSQLHNGPVGIENSDLLKSTYPNGADGTFLTLDTNHIWIWLDNQWRDAGDYQASGLSQEAQESIENTRSAVLGNELISNSSFATGKTDPAIPNTDDTHLSIIHWSDRNWLRIASDGNSPWKGVQWNFNDSNKTYFDNLIQIDFDISSLEDKNLQLYLVYFDSKGNRLESDLIDKIKLTAFLNFHYRNIFKLNQSQRNCNYVGFQIVQQNNDKIQQIIITGVSAKDVYPKIEPNKNLINFDNAQPNLPNITSLTTSNVNNERWIQIDSTGGQQYAGANWDITPVQDLPYSPLKVSFDIRGGSGRSYDFEVDLLGYNDDEKQLISLPLSRIHVDKYQLNHYDQIVILPQAKALQCTHYKLNVVDITKNPINGVLITNVSAQLHLPQKESNGNLINFLQADPNNSNITTLSASYINNKEWIQIDSTGGQQYAGANWDITPVQDLPYYPLKVSFDIRGGDKTNIFSIIINGWDSSGKQLIAVDLPDLLINAHELIHYDQIAILPQTKALQCTHFSLSVVTKSTEPINNVALSEVMLRILSHNMKYTDNLLDISQVEGNKANDLISIEKNNGNQWIHVHGDGSQQWSGIQWGLPIKSLSQELTHLNFTGYAPYQPVSMLLDIKGWDKDGKQIVEQSLGTVNFANKISGFDKIFKLSNDIEKCTYAIFSITCPNKIAFDIMINSLKMTSMLESDFVKKQYKEMHLPVISLQGDLSGISKEESKSVTWLYFDNQQMLNGFGLLKWQGNSSANFDKKGYRLKTLQSDYKKKDKVQFKASWSKQSKFNLKAYYTDGLLSRDPVNAQIGSAILANQDNLPKDILKEDNFGLIEGFPVVLFINNEYAGLYSLNSVRPDFDYTKYAIMGNQWNDITQFTAVNPSAKLDGSDFESLNPEDMPTDDEKQAVNNLAKFVSTSSDADFKDHLEEHISVNSAIDYLIFQNIIGNTDAFAKNEILLTWDGTKWFLHAYDFDNSFQGGWDGKVFGAQTGIIGTNNKLFARLITLFGDKIKERYASLRNWLTPDYVISKYQKRVDEIGVNNYKMEFDKWNNPAKDTEDFNQLTQAVYNQFKVLDQNWLVSNVKPIVDSNADTTKPKDEKPATPTEDK